ncbi:protein phosphatase 2C domain-containing protein [Janibacter terrae]|uniref:protein phosphatase 2C domain-containing protein n=1 Tax=Janibacter terrae TaxID=103817 RepID=UPI000837DAAB|nr:protein phosphatase 2C domain-containing protein [Janibacter terrae]
MGPGGPLVTVRAATLAGGEKNQDRFAYGDGWAFVLDGASSFGTTQPEHDGAWYAERLKNKLVDELTARPVDATTDIVSKAIENASAAHDDPESCPTSTLAIARWTNEVVEVYVLGDSTAALIHSEQESAVTDSRLAAIAPDLRTEYRSRLADGHGFDSQHRALLQQLQSRQEAARNQGGGYWIAGAEPGAAHHAIGDRLPLSKIEAIVLATDGAASALEYGTVDSWAAFARSDLRPLLEALHEAEESDQQAITWPRSKAHDDKTLLVIDFGTTYQRQSR